MVNVEGVPLFCCSVVLLLCSYSVRTTDSRHGLLRDLRVLDDIYAVQGIYTSRRLLFDIMDSLFCASHTHANADVPLHICAYITCLVHITEKKE